MQQTDGEIEITIGRRYGREGEERRGGHERERACRHDGEIGFGLFAVSQRYAIDATAAGGGVSPPSPMTLQYQLTVASPLELYLSVHKKDVVGYATEFPDLLTGGCMRAVMSVDGSRQ